MTKLSFLLLAAAFVVAPLASRGDADQARPTKTVEYRVRPGDTLWDLAAQIPGIGDRREAVHKLKALNGLGGGSLQIGQILQIPAP